MDNNKKLQMFIDAVNDEIDGKAAAILAQAEERKKALLAEAEEYSPAEEKASQKDGNGFAEFAQDISRAELDMKKSVIRHRDELAEKVFKAVEKRLAEYRKDPKYVDMLIKNLLLTHVPEGAEIFLSPADMKYAETLQKAIPTSSVKFTADEGIRLGGLSVYDADKGTILDKTFDSAMEEQRRAFADGSVFAL